MRLGQLGKTIRGQDGTVANDDDVVEGIVLLRKGAEADATLEALHAKIAELNGSKNRPGLLPPGVQFVPHLDRSDLVHYTTHTVLRNLTDGVLLVTLILFLFLGNVRSALIVTFTIPFSLLFAAILLDLRHIPANLLSLGALDFGMVVDGSVVMVENILRHTEFASGKRTFLETIAVAAHEVQSPVFFARMIIIAAYLPIFTLQRVEGRLFRPMAWTVAFALLGALIFALLIAPVLCSMLFKDKIKEWRNPVLEKLNRVYARTLDWCFDHIRLTLGAGALAAALMLFLAFGGIIGSEFLPHLDEGAIWVRGTLAPSTGPSAGIDLAQKARRVLADFPEVTQVVSQVGRPDDGSDASGFYNTEFFVDLRPRSEWRGQFKTKDDLIAAMDKSLGQFPGVDWNFSQPISDNVEEAVSGVKGELAVKLFGRDLKVLEQKAEELQSVMGQVPGVADLGTFQVRGQPNVNLVVDRAAADRFGINVSDVQDAVETAVGGKAVSQILVGEQRYDLTVRYQQRFRKTVEDIAGIRLLAPSGERVSLGQLCHITLDDGASTIYREGNSRYIAIKYSVRGRDLGSTVRQAIEEVGQKVALARGLSPRLDRGIRKPATRQPQAGLHRAPYRLAHGVHPLFRIRLVEVGGIDSDRGRPLATRRILQPAVDRNPLQRVVRIGVLGADWGFGGDWRHHDRVHQPVAGARTCGTRGRPGRRGAALAAHHDDHAGGHARPAAGGHVARHRLRLTTAFRDRGGGRPHCGAIHQRDSVAHPVCGMGASRRSAPAARARVCRGR